MKEGMTIIPFVISFLLDIYTISIIILLCIHIFIHPVFSYILANDRTNGEMKKTFVAPTISTMIGSKKGYKNGVKLSLSTKTRLIELALASKYRLKASVSASSSPKHINEIHSPQQILTSLPSPISVKVNNTVANRNINSNNDDNNSKDKECIERSSQSRCNDVLNALFIYLCDVMIYLMKPIRVLFAQVTRRYRALHLGMSGTKYNSRSTDDNKASDNAAFKDNGNPQESYLKVDLSLPTSNTKIPALPSERVRRRRMSQGSAAMLDIDRAVSFAMDMSNKRGPSPPRSEPESPDRYQVNPLLKRRVTEPTENPTPIINSMPGSPPIKADISQGVLKNKEIPSFLNENSTRTLVDEKSKAQKQSNHKDYGLTISLSSSPETISADSGNSTHSNPQSKQETVDKLPKSQLDDDDNENDFFSRMPIKQKNSLNSNTNSNSQQDSKDNVSDNSMLTMFTSYFDGERSAKKVNQNIPAAVRHAECAICYEDLCRERTSVFVQPDGKRVCPHFFHERCIRNLEIRHCPVCRAAFTHRRRVPDPEFKPGEFLFHAFSDYIYIFMHFLLRVEINNKNSIMVSSG